MPMDSEADTHQKLRREYEQIAQLAGGLAHEIRNPLSTICLNLEILQEELKTAETPREKRMQPRVDAIRRECQRLQDLLSEFLQFARGLELTCEPWDLSDLVRRFIQFQRPQTEAQRIEISPHLATDLPKVQLDAIQFQNVLLNLSLNALQAMPNGGVLEFQTYSDGEQVVLEIIDTGKGIPEKNLPKIFDLFFSTKSGGSGLGLPTVRKIVEAHGGHIECESEPDRGTRFRITLPILPAE